MNQSSEQDPLKRVSLSNPVHFFALGFGSGLLRPAPGTWGTLAGLIVGVILLQFLPLSFFFLLTLLGFWVGCYWCQKTAEDMQVHDHGAIVWDEVIGIFIVLLSIPHLNWVWCLSAFITFRFFDILKPAPIRYFDQHYQNGFGIMIDDVLAALYSILIIGLFRLVF